MFTNSHRNSLLKILTILCMIIPLVACSTSETGEPPVDLPEEGEVTSDSEHPLPAVMGVALDPTGEAIPLARVGDEIGDFNGVISGELDVSPTGWLTVKAFGYAAGHAHTFGEVNGTKLFEARLTPFSAGTTLTGETSETLIVQDEGILAIEITLDAELFYDLPATVMMAVIDRLDVESSYEDVDDGADLNLHYAFALQAFDETFDEIQLPPGASISVNIVLPVELGGDVVLATFNPVSGNWDSLAEACNQIDPVTYACRLDRLSPLFGVFHAAEIIREPIAQYEANLFTSVTGSGSLMRISPPSRSIEGPNWDNQFKIAWDKIIEWLKGKEMDFFTKSPDEYIDPTEDPELLELIDELIDAALNFANQNRNEAGKTHLIKAADAAFYVGHTEGADVAINEAAHIALEMGKEILKDPDCGKLQEAFKIAENNDYFDVKTKNTDSKKMAQDIYDAYVPLLEKCDIWVGTIVVRLPTMYTHPVEDFTRVSGSSEWMEVHQIMISTNVETKKSRAEDHLRLLFNVVNYSATAFECPNEITYSSSVWGKIFLIAEGFFDGLEFNFYNLRLSPISGSGGTVTQWWNFQSKYGDPPTCKPDTQQGHPLPFVSLLAHGFQDEDPVITLQEMLLSWEVGSDVIQDSRDITNPEPDTSNIPSAGGYVTWNLIHEVKLLPIDIKR